MLSCFSLQLSLTLFAYVLTLYTCYVDALYLLNIDIMVLSVVFGSLYMAGITIKMLESCLCDSSPKLQNQECPFNNVISQ